MSKKVAHKGLAPLLVIVVLGVALAGGVVWYKVAGGKTASKSLEESSQVKQTQWLTYTNQEYGYSLKYPQGWKVTDRSTKTSREVTVGHPGVQALVQITALYDPDLADLTYMQESIDEFEKKIQEDPATVQLAKFEDKIEGDSGWFIAIGEERRADLNWYFEQRGWLSTSGKVLMFHGAAQANVYKDYTDIISYIMENFRVE